MSMNQKKANIKRLTDEQRRVTQEKGTEAPFTGKYWNNHEKGIYYCVVCKEQLFSSDNKFESGSGWPSFDVPINGQAVTERNDLSLNMQRQEVVCKNCGAHLGHVFDDGPSETTGKRYCINSCSMDFIAEQK